VKLNKDQSNGTYNVVTDTHYVLVFKNISNMVEFLGFLAQRNKEFVMCTSEVIYIDSDGKLICERPDPWHNKYYDKGATEVTYAPLLSEFIVKELARLIIE